MARSYQDLVVWQKGMALAEAVYALSAQLPSEERFGLSQQLRRAAVSAPSNIAEGHERRSRAEYRRFLGIACGSLAELETQMLLADKLFRLDVQQLQEAQGLADETGRLLRAIERSPRITAA